MPLNYLFNIVDPPVVVLIYHRVIALRFDPEMLAVTPDNFRAHIRHLKETVPIVRFEDDWSKIKKPAAVITFDDGYADNVLEALPILEEAGVPATFFVSTGTIGSRREFWWHELERIILGKRGIPPCFILNDNRFGREWPTGTITERREFYNGILHLMNEIDDRQRNNWLIQLRRWAQTEASIADVHRAMTVDELRRLARSEWATIGAHTVTHTRLSSLPLEARGRNSGVKGSWRPGLAESRFFYPFGTRYDYTGER
jgi:peptidoglycan/xylan/chitin deacetylase (PgdA/CDA1 family)